MTSYSEMAARGRIESAERARGRRKVLAERIEYGPVNDEAASYKTRPVYLIGACGHTLLWDRSWPLTADGPPPRFGWKLGHRMTCGHEDCKIPPKPEVPDAERCEYIVGDDAPRRCSTRARFETDMGRACRAHRNWWLSEGYIHEDGSLRGD